MKKLSTLPAVYWYLFAVIVFAIYFAWKSLSQSTVPRLLSTSNDTNATKVITDNAIQNLTPSGIFYYEVSGEVVRPGVYKSSTSLLVDEAIALAGGFKEAADLEYVYRYIPLAVKVKAEQKIYIPAKNSSLVPPESTNYSLSTANKINLNTASLAQLDEVSGVGPATAQKIIAGRPYQSCDDVNKLKGVVQATKENIIAVCLL